jgi:hypothetical protein
MEKKQSGSVKQPKSLLMEMLYNNLNPNQKQEEKNDGFQYGWENQTLEEARAISDRIKEYTQNELS